ncbi:acyl-CoA dehydrogenase domain protein [Mycobacterium ulcerans str. Harvey]|uniref:Acyl-CoA dehydrogenase domain protein n=1 Tax=Mycobacterium ulcerans str. Harvey TaxID=1299332 RepID=A0ABN0QZK3_MYCUL|nr:acyl-CoA dehydrogenase domain protein [Mycobacterium ulcerans str. Harvey]
MIGKVTEAWRAEPALRNLAMHDDMMRLWVEAEVLRLAGERLRQQAARVSPGRRGRA